VNQLQKLLELVIAGVSVYIHANLDKYKTFLWMEGIFKNSIYCPLPSLPAGGNDSFIFLLALHLSFYFYYFLSICVPFSHFFRGM
jgi:hypothetical protein